jgi:predicted phage-related endonuclease
MALTPQQIEQRRGFLCASDVPAILGHDPYRTPTDVWLDKMGLLEEEKGGKDQAEVGDWLEAGVLDWAKSVLGPAEVKRDVWKVAGNGIMASTYDAIFGLPYFPVEAKVWRDFRDEWGPDGSDKIPAYVLAQVHAHCICGPYPVEYVAAFLKGYYNVRRAMYRIEPDQSNLAEVEKYCLWWWREYVVGDKRPSETPSLEAAQRIRRKKGITATVPPELAAKVVETSEALALAKNMNDIAKAAMLNALDGCADGECEGYEISNRGHQRQGKEVRRLLVRKNGDHGPSAEFY